MNTTELLKHLPRLVEQLKGSGYSIGTDEVLKAHTLLLRGVFDRPGSEEAPENDRESTGQWQTLQLQYSLSPIFASTAEQQQQFAGHLSYWVQHSIIDLDKPADDEENLVPWSAIAMFVIAAVFGALLLLPNFLEPGLEPLPISTAEPTTETPQEIEPAIRRGTELATINPPAMNWLQILLAAGTIAALFAAIYWWRRQFQVNRSNTNQQETTPFNLQSFDGKLSTSMATRKSVQLLRQHELVIGTGIDINASIRATINRAGLFNPVSDSRPQLPEFVLLIESASLNDHQNAFASEWFHYLLDQGLVITPYWYSGTPWQKMVDENGHVVSWQQLVSQNSQKRLLVMGEAEGWFHPMTGKLPAHCSDITAFKKAALLTHRALIDWDNREWQLQQLGLTPFNLDVPGIQQLAEFWQQQEKVTEYHLASDKLPFPDIMEDYSAHAFNDSLYTRDVVKALKDYLEPEVFTLLCATALYPECHYGITRHLAEKFFNSMNTFADLDRLAPLGRLPWMRSGRMPDPLRALLLRHLSKVELDQLRGELRKLLNLKDEQQGFSLQRYLAPSSFAAQLFRRLLGDKEQQEISQDVIFVQVMLGTSPLRLTLATETAAKFSALKNNFYARSVTLILAVTMGMAGLSNSKLWNEDWYAAIGEMLITLSPYTLALVAWMLVVIFGEAYYNRPSRFRRAINAGALALFLINLGYLSFSVFNQPKVLIQEIIYYQTILFAMVLYLSQLFSEPFNYRQGNSTLFTQQTLRVSPLAIAGAVCVVEITLLIIGWAGKDIFSSSIFHHNIDLGPTYEGYTLTRILAADLYSCLYPLLITLTMLFATKRYTHLSKNQCFHAAFLTGNINWLFMCLTRAFNTFATDFYPHDDYFQMANIILTSSVTVPAILIGAGLALCRYSKFSTHNVLISGLIVSAFYAFFLVAFNDIIGTDESIDYIYAAYLTAYQIFGFIISIALLYWMVAWRSGIKILGMIFGAMGILIAINLLTLVFMFGAGAVDIIDKIVDDESGLLTPLLIYALLVNPLTAYIFTRFAQRQFNAHWVQRSADNDRDLSALKPESSTWKTWALVVVAGALIPGLQFEVSPLNWDVSLSNDHLLALIFAWIGFVHNIVGRAIIAATFIGIICVTIMSVFAETGLLDYMNTSFNIGLLATAWFIGKIGSSMAAGSLGFVSSFTKTSSAIFLVALCIWQVSFYLTDTLALSWYLPWIYLPVLAIYASASARSPRSLSLVGITLAALGLSLNIADDYLYNVLNLDFLSIGVYGGGLSVLVLASTFYVGYQYLNPARLQHTDSHSMVPLLGLIVLSMISIHSELPPMNYTSQFSGSTELVLLLMFLFGFFFKQWLRPSLLLIVLSGSLYYAYDITSLISESANAEEKILITQSTDNSSKLAAEEVIVSSRRIDSRGRFTFFDERLSIVIEGSIGVLFTMMLFGFTGRRVGERWQRRH